MCQSARPETIAKLCMQYIKSNKRIEQSTAAVTEWVFRRLVAAVGDLGPADFGFAEAERFQRSIVDSGCKAVTANIYVKTARPVFRWALRNGWIAEDPFAHVRLLTVPEGEIRIYEPDEFERLLTGCRSRLWQGRILLAKTAALRRGEILNLTVADIDFGRGVITVRPKKETAYTWRWLPKSKRRREVPLAEAVSKFLTRYIWPDLSDRQPYFMLAAERYDRIQQLRRGAELPDRVRRCPDENFTKPFERIRERAIVADGTFHDLRRTCITEWLENGLQPHEVRRLAGHASIETTMRYYVATRRALIDRARAASQKVIGAAGYDPATS